MKYNPSNYKNAKGEFDFSKAKNYDENLVRSNLNHVVRDIDTVIVAPTLEKEIVF